MNADSKSDSADSTIMENVKKIKSRIIATNQVFKLTNGAKSKMDETIKQNNTLTAQIDDVKSALSRSEDRVKELEEKLQSNSDTVTQINNYTTTISSLESELNKSKSELNQKNMYIQQLEAKANELKELCEQQKKDLSAGKAKEKHKQELTKKNNEIKTLQSQLNTANTQLDEVRKEVQELNSQNETLQEEVNKLDEENMVLKIEKDMDSMDEDDEAVNKVNHSEEIASLRKELDDYKEANCALIAAEKERATKLDTLTKDLKKHAERNIELEKAEKKYQHELNEYKHSLHKLDGTQKHYNEVVKKQYETAVENKKLKELIDARPESGAFAEKMKKLEENNTQLKRDIDRISKKYKDLKEKTGAISSSESDSPALRSSYSSESSSSPQAPRQKEKKLSPVTLKHMKKLKLELAKVKIEKDLLLEQILKEKLAKGKTLDELILSEDSSDEGSTSSYQSNVSPLLLSSPTALSSSIRLNSSTIRSMSPTVKPSSPKALSVSPTMDFDELLVRSNTTKMNSSSPKIYTSSSPISSNAPTLHSSSSKLRSTSPNVRSLSPKVSSASPKVQHSASTSQSGSPLTQTPPSTQRNNSYGSSGLIAPPSALSLSKPKKKVSNSKLVKFANSKNPGKLIKGSSLPAPMTPSELIPGTNTQAAITSAVRPSKRPLVEDDQDEPMQIDLTKEPTTIELVNSPTNETEFTPAASPSPARSVSVTPASTSAVAKQDVNSKKRKIETSLLKSIDECMKTNKIISIDEITLKDIDKAFIEIIESFSSMKSGISPEASPDNSYGIKDQFTIQVPNNFYKTEKDYAWYLSYLSTKEQFYEYIMETIIEKIKFDCRGTKRDGIIARWIRLASLITRSKNDNEKIVFILSEMAGASNGKKFFPTSVLNVTRAFNTCLKLSESIPNLSRTLQVALAHIASKSSSENANSIYTKIAPILQWPELDQATSLTGLIEENLKMIPDVAQKKNDEKDYLSSRRYLNHSLKISFSILNDWKLTYNGFIIDKLWPLLGNGNKATTEIVVELLGTLGSLGVSDDVLVDNKPGVEFLQQTLRQIMDIEDEEEKSLCAIAGKAYEKLNA